MGTGNLFKSDLYALNNYVQNTASTYTTSLIIETLRELFSQDSYYRYVADEWGFPKTPAENDMPYDAGINDTITTRVFIGEYFRQNIQFYPAILVKNAGYRSVPISMSRNKFFLNWENIKYSDGYGNSKIVKRPMSYEQNGAWEGNISIDIISRSSMARSDLVDIIMLSFVDTNFETLQNAGVVIKGISAGSPSESDDRNDKLFKNNINLEVRMEWSRVIPIDKVIEVINFCIEFGNTDKTPFIPAPNLTIHNTIELLDKLNSS